MSYLALTGSPTPLVYTSADPSCVPYVPTPTLPYISTYPNKWNYHENRKPLSSFDARNGRTNMGCYAGD